MNEKFEELKALLEGQDEALALVAEIEAELNGGGNATIQGDGGLHPPKPPKP